MLATLFTFLLAFPSLLLLYSILFIVVFFFLFWFVDFVVVAMYNVPISSISMLTGKFDQETLMAYPQWRGYSPARINWN